MATTFPAVVNWGESVAMRKECPLEARHGPATPAPIVYPRTDDAMERRVARPPAGTRRLERGNCPFPFNIPCAGAERMHAFSTGVRGRVPARPSRWMTPEHDGGKVGRGCIPFTQADQRRLHTVFRRIATVGRSASPLPKSEEIRIPAGFGRCDRLPPSTRSRRPFRAQA